MWPPKQVENIPDDLRDLVDSLPISAMTRVFAKQSDTKILERLEKFFKEVGGITTQSEYDALHSGFLRLVCPEYFNRSQDTPKRAN
jgi:hypothetical protein